MSLTGAWSAAAQASPEPLIVTERREIRGEQGQAAPVTDETRGQPSSPTGVSPEPHAAGASVPATTTPPQQANPLVATTKRTAENVVTQAEDAFGTSIGRESIGLYSAGSVRGFSPISAGNARIDNLYFDQVEGPNSRIRRSANIRVGLSALGFPFPSPTGIVDYALRSPGRERSASAFAAVDSFGSGILELDGEQPLGETLSIGGGLGLYKNEFRNGTNNLQHTEALNVRWTPTPSIEVQPFWQRSDVYDDDIGPNYIPAGSYLPPRLPRRQSFGPEWAEYEGAAILYGVKASVAAGPRTTARLGVFRSLLDDRITAANLYTGLTEDGAARQIIIIDPTGKFASTSGELRVTRAVPDGPRVHLLHASLRGRARERRYGGSNRIDLGSTRLGEAVTAPKPEFEFGEQSNDQVRQRTGGLAYEGRWKRVGELSLGAQKTDYTKEVQLPGAPPAETGSSPWLFNTTAAAYVTDKLAIYAGYVRGLEESGTAPANAVNRNQPLPAIETSQSDAGLRWAITPDLRLVVGVFEVRKPYFQLDEANVFALLGDVRNRGLELSLAGKLTARLNVVAGAVLLDPEVTGEGVRLGRVGRRPVGLAERTLRFNADWRPSFSEKLSFDVGVNHSSSRPSTRDNRVFVPERTTINLGARYRLREGDQPLTLRLAATNLFDVYGYDIISSGSYDVLQGRLVALSLAADF